MRIVRVFARATRVATVLAACSVAAVAPAAGQQQAVSASRAAEVSPDPLAFLPVLFSPVQLDLAPVRPQAIFPVRTVDQPQRPGALLPLYGSLVALQGLDIHSTRGAVESGSGREANPAMRPFVSNSAAFIAVKAGATAGVIWASEKLWKKNRKGALILASAVNVAMAAIVANNYRVSR